MKQREKAVVTVVGKNRVGILANAATVCAENNVNVVDISQSLKDVFFTMIMLVDITEMTCSIEDLDRLMRERLPEMQISVMHEEIFNAMHTI